jgi:phospholipid/cholesterol/gamma-HCH transport system substrate-binding protein
MSTSRQIALGAFLIGGVLLFAAGLFWIGDRRQLFSQSIDLYTEFSNLSGLSAGAKVRVSGLDAGEVLEIQIPSNPDARFRVRFRALSDFQPILRTDSLVSIQNDGLVGNKFLQVEAGSSAANPVASGDTLPSREPIEIADLISQVSDTVRVANQTVMDIRANVNDTVEGILNVAQQTTNVINEVSEQVETLATTGNAIGQDLKAVVANVREGRGTFGQLLNDDRLYQQLRAAVSDGQQVTENFKNVSADLRTVSDDLKRQELGPKVDRIAGNLETLTQEAINAVRGFQGPEGASGGLMAEIRQTLSSANETMANFADNSEALKRNFFFRGFFNQRGYFDLDAVTVRDYSEGRFLPDRQKVMEWLEGADVFAATSEGNEQITNEGQKKLDLAMAGFLRYSKNEPFIIESWAGPGSEPERALRSRERGIMVSEYLIRKFDLKPNYVAIMPMNADAPSSGPPRDGVGLVLFAPRSTRQR